MSAPRRCRRSTTTADTIAHAGAHTDAPSAAAAEAAAAAATRLWRALLLAWWCRLRKPLGPRRVARASRPAAVCVSPPPAGPYGFTPLPPAAVRPPVQVDAGGGTASNSTAAAKAAGTVLRERTHTSRPLTLIRTLAISGRRSLPPTLSLSLALTHSHPHSLSFSLAYTFCRRRRRRSSVVIIPSSSQSSSSSRRYYALRRPRLPRYCTARAVFRYVRPCLHFETA